MPGATLVPRRDPELRGARARAARPRPGRRRRDRTLADPRAGRADRRRAARRRRRAAAPGLIRLGVRRGDRVAAFLPNIPEAIDRRCSPRASLGATWSSCAPEFGDPGGRRPASARSSRRVLLAVDGYRYGDKVVDRRGRGRRGPRRAARRSGRPSSSRTSASEAERHRRGPGRDRVVGAARRARPRSPFEPVPFDHPLYVLFSSGTTGPAEADRPRARRDPARAPQGARAPHGPRARRPVLLVHDDRLDDVELPRVGPRRRLDRRAVRRQPGVARPVARCGASRRRPRTTYLGVSAPFLMACRAAGLAPGRDARPVARCAASGSTGAPLPAAGFRWVGDAVSDAIPVGSLSGGTDLCTGFLGPSPLVPVWSGEISCRMLGARVEAFDPAGRSLVGAQGELVITAPMPSMPVGLWGDADGSRLRAAYFEPCPGVWRHGDWLTITDRGSCVITGRSDATLNRGGVRIGTAEFYAVVEALPGGRRQPRRPPRGRGAAARASCCCSSCLRDGATLDDGAARRGSRGALRAEPLAAPRAGRDPGGAGDPADAVGQEARGAGEADPAGDAAGRRRPRRTRSRTRARSSRSRRSRGREHRAEELTRRPGRLPRNRSGRRGWRGRG